jgi:hypothetical protein
MLISTVKTVSYANRMCPFGMAVTPNVRRLVPSVVAIAAGQQGRNHRTLLSALSRGNAARPGRNPSLKPANSASYR